MAGDFLAIYKRVVGAFQIFDVVLGFTSGLRIFLRFDNRMFEADHAVIDIDIAGRIAADSQPGFV